MIPDGPAERPRMSRESPMTLAEQFLVGAALGRGCGPGGTVSPQQATLSLVLKGSYSGGGRISLSSSLGLRAWCVDSFLTPGLPHLLRSSMVCPHLSLREKWVSVTVSRCLTCAAGFNPRRSANYHLCFMDEQMGTWPGEASA